MSAKASAKNFYQVIKQTLNEFIEDKCPRLGAALAYYTIFSLAPLLIIVSGVAGIFFGKDETRAKVTQAINQMASPQAGQALSNIFKPGNSYHGVVATVIGVASLLFGAAGIFSALQDSLNTIWGVTAKPGRGILGVLRDRILSFSMVGAILFLLLSSLIITTMIEALGGWLTQRAGPDMHFIFIIVNFVVSYVVITLLFAMIYKVLPDVQIAWKDVWIGSAVTAALFVVGKFGLGLYLGHASIGSVYGAAGSLLVLLTWIYYSSQIFLIGAEFVQVWVKERGDQFTPSDNAIPLTRSARAAQGIPKENDLVVAAVRAGKTVDPEAQPDPLAGFDMETRRAAHRRQHTAKSGHGVLPMTFGFATGFLAGKLRRKPSKLVLRRVRHR